jgi:hypothetical protein
MYIVNMSSITQIYQVFKTNSINGKVWSNHAWKLGEKYKRIKGSLNYFHYGSYHFLWFDISEKMIMKLHMYFIIWWSNNCIRNILLFRVLQKLAKYIFTKLHVWNFTPIIPHKSLDIEPTEHFIRYVILYMCMCDQCRSRSAAILSGS